MNSGLCFNGFRREIFFKVYNKVNLPCPLVTKFFITPFAFQLFMQMIIQNILAVSEDFLFEFS